MGQDITARRLWLRDRQQAAAVRLGLPGLLAVLAFALMLGQACSSDDPAPRSIRGHVTDYGGVPHANAAFAGARHCISCHGAALAGGTNGEPSCYTCHGKNWNNDEGAASAAPGDHTEVYQGFRHHPGLNSPDENCAVCHGADLQGDISNGLTRPGCEVCHGAVWQ